MINNSGYNGFFNKMRKQADKMEKERAAFIKGLSTKAINERLLGIKKLEKNKQSEFEKKVLRLTREELNEEIARRYDKKTNS
tara:strand:+ start:69 stop:314 length:246 start_codon:yes stop_codon:yes gene_type:complete